MKNQSDLEESNLAQFTEEGGWTTPSGFTVKWASVSINKSYDINFSDNIAAYIAGCGGAYLVFNQQEPFKIKRVGVRVEHTKVSSTTVRVKLVSTLSDGDGAEIWPNCHGIIVIGAWIGASSEALFYNNFGPIVSGTTSLPVSTGGRSIQSLVTGLNSFTITLGGRDYVKSMTVNASGKIEPGDTSVAVSGVSEMSTDGAGSSGELQISAIAQLVDAGDYAIKMVQLESGDTAYGESTRSTEVTFSRAVEQAVVINASLFLDYISDTRAVSCILIGPSRIGAQGVYYNLVSWSGSKVTISAAPTMYRTKWGLKGAYCSRTGTQDFIVLAKLATGDAKSEGEMTPVLRPAAAYVPPQDGSEGK